MGGMDSARATNSSVHTVWLTGLSGAGKSTIAAALHQHLQSAGKACVEIDGDEIRRGLCADLGFSPQDRAENLRRVAHVCKLFNDAGLTAIVALISPYREDRARAAQIVGVDRFIEVHVATPLAVCETRDPKGLYVKARAGEIASFTGISAPYETPLEPALSLDTSVLDLLSCVAHISGKLGL